MNPILYGIYQFLKLIVRIALRIYYPQTTVVNRDYLNFDGPAILVSNHPNTLLDPFQLGLLPDRPIFFLANAGLFKTKLTNWFFSTFFCIPIQRREDTHGKIVNNEEAFAKCDAFLTKGGLLFIAPEGGSFIGGNLKRIKTGTARIALSAENKNDFDLGLKIVPFGLNYEDPFRFRSKLLINIGKPITLEQFEEDYHRDGFGTARKITDDLTERLRSLIIDPENELEEQFFDELRILQENSLRQSPGQAFVWLKNKIAALRSMPAPAFSNMLEESRNYFKDLKTYRIFDKSVARHPKPAPVAHFKAIVGFPIFLWGAINHLFAAGLPYLIWEKTSLYPTYESTVKLLAGVVFLPLFYLLQWSLVSRIWSEGAGWIYFLSLFPAGLFAWAYGQWFRHWRSDRSLAALRRNNPAKVQDMVKRRDRLWKAVSAL